MSRVSYVIAVVCLMVAAAPTVTSAQESLLGTYTGNYIFPGTRGDTPLGVKLTITKVEAGVVNGDVVLSTRGPCSGDYPMQGKYEDKKLAMRSTAKGGRASDCSFSFNVVVDGTKLVGTTGGGRALQLSK